METTEPKDTKPEGLATVNDVAEFMKITRPSVYKLIRSGDLPSLKIGRSRRIRWVDVHSFVDPSNGSDT